jgi:hypothetical protein
MVRTAVDAVTDEAVLLLGADSLVARIYDRHRQAGVRQCDGMMVLPGSSRAPNSHEGRGLAIHVLDRRDQG